MKQRRLETVMVTLQREAVVRDKTTGMRVRIGADVLALYMRIERQIIITWLRKTVASLQDTSLCRRRQQRKAQKQLVPVRV